MTVVTSIIRQARRVTLVGVLLSSGAPLAAHAATETVLYSFKGGADGSVPTQGLVMDAAGNLYGTTSTGGAANAGTVFELSPPAVGQTQWTETVIYTFQGGVDGSDPLCSLVFDPQGNLYGTTYTGGSANAGTVFELSPNGSGGWSEQILVSFDQYTKGRYPAAGLIIGPLGHLYGTTAYGGPRNLNYGLVFELVPPAAGSVTWREQVLYTFQSNDGHNPMARLTRKGGNLYGSVEYGLGGNSGGVFEIFHPTTASQNWTETLLAGSEGYPEAGASYASSVTIDKNGNAFTTEVDGGGLNRGGAVNEFSSNVFVSQTSIYVFGGEIGVHPDGGLLLNRRGDLFGTASQSGAGGNGSVFELKPPVSGSTSWRPSPLYNFVGGLDGATPTGDLIIDPANNLYGVTQGGGHRQSWDDLPHYTVN